MFKPRELLKYDIVGHSIKNVWVSPWEEYLPTSDHDPFDGKSFCFQRGFLELDDTTLFEVQSQNDYEELPILSLDFSSMKLIPGDQDICEQSVGKKILEVLTSSIVPSFCILLENKILLYCSAEIPWIYKLHYAKLGAFYTTKHFSSYWGHCPLNSLLGTTPEIDY